jgi:hypothetical protein
MNRKSTLGLKNYYLIGLNEATGQIMAVELALVSIAPVAWDRPDRLLLIILAQGDTAAGDLRPVPADVKESRRRADVSSP